MKKKTLFAALSALALSFATSTTASAALLFGFHSFNDSDSAEGASDGVFSGTSQVTKSESSSSTGGSTDGLYGGSALTSGGANNGYIRLTAFSPTIFSILNSSATTYSLDALYFDFSRGIAPGAGDVDIQIDEDFGGPNFLVYQTIPSGGTSVDLDTNYLDSSIFFVDFGGRSLNPGESFAIHFTAYDTDVVIDNIALTGTAQVAGIPEVANFAALGGLLISGLAIRSRRRSSAKA
jgi:hypothetical protein